ncbi:DUF885 domain-containing protein [Xanthomonadaceae bacterium JHOS43]|nr:DUF885 domain-containing protein [Xanthomonadaceae bacterium JHOS43]
MIKRLFKWASALLVALALAVSALAAHTWYFKPLNIEWFYTRVFLQFALDNPEMLTQIRLLEPLGIKGHNAELADASLAREDELMARLERDYATFQRYKREDYSGQQRLSYDIFESFLGDQVREGKRFRYHNFPINQMFGAQSSLPNFMINSHFIESERDARDFISRVGQFERRFDQIIEGLEKRESLGILPPRFTVEKVLDQMRDFIAMPVEEHMLHVGFGEKLDKIPAEKLAEDRRAELRAELARAIETSVYPAYRKLIAHHETLLPKATSSDGVWRLPDGEDFYAWRVRNQTTTTMSAEQIHRIGVAEVERIAAEMNAILQGEGLVEGSIGDRVQQIAKREDQLYPDTDEGREQILADYQAIIDEISAGLGDWFGRMPSSRVEVRRVPAFSEKTAPGAYYQGPSLDGKRPGVFFANLRNVGEIPRFGMRTLAYHEAVPGHHFQIALAQELEGLPIFRRFLPFTVYSEGWALYSEQVAWEAGFQSNPLDNLGRLQAEMFRAVRLVVDTGMHSQRWSREQAIDYMREYTGMGEDEVTAEIERYLVNPGQALAYKVGMLKFVELRQKAERELGDRFDIRAFHDVVLGSGSVPIFVLERLVDEWIEQRKG